MQGFPAIVSIQAKEPIHVCVTGECMKAFKFVYSHTKEFRGKNLIVYEHVMDGYRDLGILIHEGGPPELLTQIEVLQNEQGTLKALVWCNAMVNTYLWSKFFWACEVWSNHLGIVLLYSI